MVLERSRSGVIPSVAGVPESIRDAPGTAPDAILDPAGSVSIALAQFYPRLGDVAANLGVDLDVALEELGLDRPLEDRGNLIEDLSRGAAQGHRLAVDEVELDLDAEGGMKIGDEFVRGHEGLLRTALRGLEF